MKYGGCTTRKFFFFFFFLLESFCSIKMSFSFCFLGLQNESDKNKRNGMSTIIITEQSCLMSIIIFILERERKNKGKEMVSIYLYSFLDMCARKRGKGQRDFLSILSTLFLLFVSVVSPVQFICRREHTKYSWSYGACVFFGGTISSGKRDKIASEVRRVLFYFDEMKLSTLFPCSTEANLKIGKFS